MWIRIDEAGGALGAEILSRDEVSAVLPLNERLYVISLHEFEPKSSGFTRYIIQLDPRDTKLWRTDDAVVPSEKGTL